MKLKLLASRGCTKKNIIGLSTNSGDVHAAGGLNWGYSNGLPKIEDAYITLPKSKLNQNPLFFNNQSIITAEWDDGMIMQLHLEGHDGHNPSTPKQIASLNCKSILGKYLRERIGSRIGKNLLFTNYQGINKNRIPNTILNDKFITLNDLNNYGRIDIEITPMINGNFKFNFK